MNIAMRLPRFEFDDKILEQGAEISRRLNQLRMEKFPPNATKTLRSFSMAEVAHYLGVSQNNLKRLHLEGKGPMPEQSALGTAVVHRRADARASPLPGPAWPDRGQEVRPAPQARRQAPGRRGRELQGRKRQDHDRGPPRPAPGADRAPRPGDRSRPASVAVCPAWLPARTRSQPLALRGDPLRRRAQADRRRDRADEFPGPGHHPSQSRTAGIRVRHAARHAGQDHPMPAASSSPGSPRRCPRSTTATMSSLSIARRSLAISP